MEKKERKPRLVFFQGKHDALPAFMRMHLHLHVKCLSEFFDVILINYDCDYKQVCDIYEPDLALFEGGWKSTLSKRLIIKNTSVYPQIPKLGLHNGDGWCECRVSFFADMDRWGIENFFSISTTTTEHIPEVADHLFVWPNFIDTDIYRDYNQTKDTPVLFTGSIFSLYPWREKMYDILSCYYPYKIIPHSGYEAQASKMKFGEQYARSINSSWFVPSCGSVAKEVVRKHFEVPGSKSCLITEKTPMLEAAGFVDMQNCVFADGKDVIDKLNYLFRNVHELESIINNGYKLVHSRHTLQHRDQILQWFNLYKSLKPSQNIIQKSPFDPLTVEEKSNGNKNNPIICNGLHLELLRKGDEKLWAGNFDEAEEQYLRCSKYIPYLSEPKLKLGICNLHRGNVTEALNYILQPIQNQLGLYKSSEPDPVEWAYFIISLLAHGKLDEAIIRANQFRSIYHPELDRTRYIVHYLKYNDKSPIENIEASKSRYSIHQIPKRSFTDWITNICSILNACNQTNYAKQLYRLISSVEKPIESNKQKANSWKQILNKNLLSQRIRYIDKSNSFLKILHIPESGTGLPSISIYDYLARLGKCVGINKFILYLFQVRNILKGNNQTTIGIEKNQERAKMLPNIIERDDIRSILVIGPSALKIYKEAIFIDKQAKRKDLKVVYIDLDISSGQSMPLQTCKSLELKLYKFIFSAFTSFSSDLNKYINNIKEENAINHFDLVIIDNGWLYNMEDLNELEKARFIILNRITSLSNYKNKKYFTTNHDFILEAENNLNNGGYAIFQNLVIKRRKHSIITLE